MYRITVLPFETRTQTLARTRGGDDWTLAGRSVTALGGKANEDRRYVDLAIVPNAQHGQGGSSVIFLVEKKNKGRGVVAIMIMIWPFILIKDQIRGRSFLSS